MTVIVNAIWGGRVSLVVDRNINQEYSDGSVSVVDSESNKVVIVLSLEKFS